MKLLTKESPEGARNLVEEVIYKAEGVFLWVTLVVKSLLKGLSQRDGISELMRRLNTFPSDLELLYAHMLRSIEPIYMEEGSKYFQLYRVDSRYELPSVELIYIALIVDLQRVLRTPTEDLHKATNEPVRIVDWNSQGESFSSSIYDFESLYEYLDDRMRTRCGGLIECTRSISKEGISGRLSYIHRTVKDYLELEDVWDDILAHTAHLSKADFDPQLQMLMSHVLSLKRGILWQTFQPRGVKEFVQDQWTSTYKYVWELKLSHADTQNLLLNEFDRVATNLNQSASHDEEKQQLQNQHWSNYQLPDAWETNFLCEAIRQVLISYVRTKAVLDNALPQRKSGMPFLGFAFLAKWPGVPTSEELAMTELLLEQGANPNDVYEGYTIWQYWIHSLHSRRVQGIFSPPDGYRASISRVLKLFLERDVDLNVCCIKEFQIWKHLYATERLDGNVEGLRDCLIEHTKHQGSNDAENSPVTGAEATEEHDSFKELHSLTAVVKDWFNTEEDPHGAGELLDLIAKLKADKETLKEPSSRRRRVISAIGRKFEKGGRRTKRRI